jgi:outer membrane protein TolC
MVRLLSTALPSRFSRMLHILSLLLLGLGMSVPAVQAETLSLDDVIRKAVDASHELKIAQLDIKINRTDVKAARAEYLPTIRATLNMEYLRDLEKEFRPVTAVGNNVIPAGTRFQNSVGVSMNQNLIDFGSRKRKVRMAQEATSAKAAAYFQALRDLQLKLTELYTEALISYKSLKANESLLSLAQQGYQLKKRLYEAGTTSNLDVAEEAIQVAQALDNIQVYKDQFQQKLQNLAYYTREPYLPAETVLSDLQDEPGTQLESVSVASSPEARMYDALISQKKNEIEYLKRQYLPQVSLYSYYNLYGFDPDRWSKSVGNLSQRTVSLGVSVMLPVFDGLKNQAAIQKAQLEREKLALQKSEKLAQLQHQADLYAAQMEGYSVQLQTKARILNKAQDKLTMVNRLSEQQLVEQSRAIKEHMERIKKQVEVEKSLIQGVSALKKLKILAEN